MEAVQEALLGCSWAAATAHAARATRTSQQRAAWARALPMLLGFVLIAAGCIWRPPGTSLMGAGLALAAALVLAGAHGAVPALAAGGCAALAGVTGMAMGWPPWIALPAALAAPLVSAHLASSRPGYASPRMTDEALCGILFAALLLAALPAVDGGWRNALALNRGTMEMPAALAGAGWVWCVAAAGFAAGLLGGWLKRR